MTSSSLHPSSAARRPDASRNSTSPGPSLTPLTPTVSATSLSSSQTLSRTISTASSAPSVTRTKSKVSQIPRSQSSSRLSLKYQAQTWRFLEGIGVYLNAWPKPYPPEPSFTCNFSTSDTPSASLELVFYAPKNYEKEKKKGRRYPVVVNFHGGGFTLGSTRDDARWAAFILQETSAVIVSVEYRLAPEHPFPTAVEDGVEALLHLGAQSERYGIDPKQIALSGFSAGGNLSFTVPLRLHDHIQTLKDTLPEASFNDPSTQPPLPEIISIIAFYPALDMRISRAQRRALSSHPEKTLPPILTSLFDESYMPDESSKISPYASPPVASDDTLIKALPDRIAFYLCEWDMLLLEGKDFAERLRSLGKNVELEIIAEKRHAFDKAPQVLSVDPKVGMYYTQACRILKEVFDAHASHI